VNEIAAIVLTRNEGHNIGACLDSLDWADERVVFDQFSTDDTVAIARTRGATVQQHPFENFAAQRNAALAQSTRGWVFFVDADERATPELGDEIRRAVYAPRVGWWVPRHNYIFGKCIRHGGWYPDYQMRLLRRGRAHYDPARPVHEVGVLDGEAGYLQCALTHYNYSTLGQFFRKQGQYAEYDARMQVEKGDRTRFRSYLGQPTREFWRRFISLQGYRDGAHGLLLAVLMARYAWNRCRLVARIQSRG
jgi:glycosyltransferase involved in cell wall biosynthesis